MSSPKPECAHRHSWRELFWLRLSDGLIVASAVSMAVIAISASSETISTKAAAGIVFSLYGLALLFAVAASLVLFMSVRCTKPFQATDVVSKEKPEQR
jgi:hypothetical protein